MIKKIAFLSAAVLTLSSFASCGIFKSDSIDGKYVPIPFLTYGKEKFKENLDNAVRDSVDEKLDYYMNDVKGASGCIKFNKDKDSFVSYAYDFSIKTDTQFYGTYTTDDDRILFNYSEMIFQRDGEDEISVMPDDDTSGNRVTENMRKKLINLNESNNFSHLLASEISVWYYDAYDVMPLPLFDSTSFKNEKPGCPLKYSGEFLCTDLFGTKLQDSYTYEHPFELSYNITDTFKNNPDSPYNTNSFDSEDEKNNYLMECANNLLNASKAYSTDPEEDTSIVFSDGIWEWYNSDGELINNGAYLESEAHTGLISMFLTDSSKVLPKKLVSETPAMLLYISDDGKVYYPAFIKTKTKE